MSNSTVTLIGGIGDILLNFSGLENISNLFDNKIDCHIFTHYTNADNLLLQFSFNKHFYFYKDQEEFVKLMPTINKLVTSSNYIGEVELYNSTIFPDIVIPTELHGLDSFFENNKLEPNNYVVIHPFGSHYSNDFITKNLKKQSKNIESTFLLELINFLNSKNLKPIIVCSKPEKDLINIPNALIYTSDNIWESFALVNNSLFVIAADSAIKSFSAIIKKPTIVFVANYEDKTRDEKFLTPYELEGNYFRVIRYESYNDDALNQALEILNGWT